MNGIEKKERRWPHSSPVDLGMTLSGNPAVAPHPARPTDSFRLTLMGQNKANSGNLTLDTRCRGRGFGKTHSGHSAQQMQSGALSVADSLAWAGRMVNITQSTRAFLRA
jgi:hypothetical protein